MADRQIQEIMKNDTELLDWLESESCDLRCCNSPTGGDDADIVWQVIEHHMAKPHERAIGHGKTPRHAIFDAMLPEGDPLKSDYVPQEFVD